MKGLSVLLKKKRRTFLCLEIKPEEQMNAEREGLCEGTVSSIIGYKQVDSRATQG